MSKTQTFEEKMQELELLVRRLEQGEVPLEEALKQFEYEYAVAEPAAKLKITLFKTFQMSLR